jgi:two-component system response regulator FixJ
MPSTPTTPKDIVLVIDDDSAVLASLKFALEIEGFVVEAFRSAEELLDRQSMPPSACLVVDYWLPGIDGVELVSTLRERGVEIPAFLITTDPPPHVRQKAGEAGLVIVEKPLLGNALAEAIRSVVKG